MTSAGIVGISNIISEADLDRLSALIQARGVRAARERAQHGLDAAKAKRRLAQVLQGIPVALGLTGRKRPQGERNAELEAVASAAHRLRVAYSRLDKASRAALFLEMLKDAESDGSLDPDGYLQNLTDQEGEERWLRPGLPNSSTFDWFLLGLDRFASASLTPAQKGAPVDAGADAAVELLAKFVTWCGPGHVALSAKESSPFLTFARDAVWLATGENRDLVNSAHRVTRGWKALQSTPILPRERR